MHKQGVKKFPYYVGVNSLADIATKDDRVCVLNILGTESRAPLMDAQSPDPEKREGRPGEAGRPSARPS